jgi:hypothetical protein
MGSSFLFQPNSISWQFSLGTKGTILYNLYVARSRVSSRQNHGPLESLGYEIVYLVVPRPFTTEY